MSRIALYFDTETSDFTDRELPTLHPRQPLIVQLAAVLSYEDGRAISTVSFLLQQTGWVGIKNNEIAERCVKIHGITNDLCESYGIPPEIVLHTLRNMISKADVVVAHNVEFDLDQVNRCVWQQNLPAIRWPEIYCTMKQSAPIVQMPSRGGFNIGGFKAPKLAEAYRHFVGKEMVNAHDALADVYACRAVHKGILAHHKKETSSDI